MAEEIQTIVQNVQLFYSQTLPQNYKEIEFILKEFKKSEKAWYFAQQLLQLPNQIPEVYLFSAQTLKSKFKFDFEEIRYQDLTPIIRSLIQLTHNFVNQEKVVMQLAECLGILSVQMPELFYEQVFSELQQQFSQSPSIMLEILKCIAQEIEDNLLVVDIDNIEIARDRALANQTSIFQYFDHCIVQGNVHLVLESFVAWLQIGADPLIIVNIGDGRLIQMCIESLQLPQYLERGCSSLCQLFKLTKDKSKYGQIADKLFQSLGGLIPMIQQKAQNQDYQDLEHLCKVFVMFGEYHIDALIKQSENTSVQQYFTLMCQLLQIDDKSIVKLVAQFWNKFCRSFKYLFDDPDQKQTQRNNYQQFMTQFINICVTQCVLTYDQYQNIQTNADDIDEDKTSIRYEMQGIIQDTTMVLDYMTVYQILQSNLEMLEQQKNELNQTDYYIRKDALLICLTALAELNNDDQVYCIDQTARLILRGDQNNLQLIRDICNFLDRAAKNISQEVARYSIEYLQSLIQANQNAPVASKAFQSICYYNKDNLQDITEKIYGILDKIDLNNTIVHQNVLKGISFVVFASKQQQEITQRLEMLIGRYAQRLRDVMILSQQQGVNKSVEQMLCNILDSITAIIKVILDDSVEPQSVLSVFRQLWPIMKDLFQLYLGQADGTEELCRIMKHIMRKLEENFSEFIQEFAEIFINGFEQTGFCSYLYMAENLVRTFGRYPDYASFNFEMFNRMNRKALAMLNSLQTILSNPELGEDYFGMLIRFLNYCPQAIIQSQQIHEIMNCCLMALESDSRDLIECNLCFIENLSVRANPKLSQYDVQIQKIALDYFGQVIKILINRLLEPIDEEIMYNIINLIIKICQDIDSKNWLTSCLIDIPHYVLTQSEKEKIVLQCDDSHLLYGMIRMLHKRALMTLKHRAN